MREPGGRVTLGSLCERITVGHVGPMANSYTSSGVPFLRSQDIGEFRISTSGIKFISPDFDQKLKKSRLKVGDVAIVRTGYPGTAAVVPQELDGANCADLVILTPGPELDAWFVASLLNSAWGRGHVSGVLVGVAQQHFNVSAARDLKTVFPPLLIQQRIGSIIRTYCDLIEVNQRRIAILEDMARRLFDGWFVRFRYPGHEAEPLIETELGMVPEGWAIVRAEEMIDFDPRTKVPKEGIKRFVPMGSLDTVSSVISDWETRSGNSGSKFQKGDTLFARITPCLENGKTGLVDFLEAGETAFGSTEFTVMRGKGVSSSFVYLLARSEAFRAIAIKSMGGADGRQRVRTEALKGYEFACPPTGLLSKFTSVTGPLLQQVRVLANQNARLRTARDLLLPKLISGEIDVSAAEETFAEAAE